MSEEMLDGLCMINVHRKTIYEGIQTEFIINVLKNFGLKKKSCNFYFQSIGILKYNNNIYFIILLQ